MILLSEPTSETEIATGCFAVSESAAARPKLKLLPRTVKDPVNTVVHTERNTSIFGTGKPRDEGKRQVLVTSLHLKLQHFFPFVSHFYVFIIVTPFRLNIVAVLSA